MNQNYRFFYSKLTVFWSHFSLPKNDQFCYKKSVISIQSKKGCLDDFGFQYFDLPKHVSTWIQINLARFALYAPVPTRAISGKHNAFLVTEADKSRFLCISLGPSINDINHLGRGGIYQKVMLLHKPN